MAETATTTRAEHTPTPWRVGRAGSVVADAPVCKGPLGSDDVAYYGGHLVCETVTPSNAEFIVRACNAHDEMYEALNRLLEWRQGNTAANAQKFGETYYRMYLSGGSLAVTKRLDEEGRAAIAKAEGR